MSSSASRNLCPDGVNVYFDNVGGSILEAALANLAKGARVVLCGGISGYNEKVATARTTQSDEPGDSTQSHGGLHHHRLRGALSPRPQPRLTKWVDEGKIVNREDIQEGIENAPETFLRLFRGQNIGKQLLKVGEAT